ncbi:unnamed protein product [Ilex paraguariensis]|uniref:Uncharacterized protein n=1 Tax=Ilex paraguariensis TaxID=185542 RepID=A0ABC8S300_9AQUA
MEVKEKWKIEDEKETEAEDSEQRDNIKRKGKKPFAIELSIAEAKLIKDKKNCAKLTEQVGELTSEAEVRLKTEEEIIRECEDDVMATFEDLQLKTFKKR